MDLEYYNMKHWTTEEEDQLRILAINHNVKQIAMMMGRHEKSVQIRLQKLKVKAKRVNGWQDMEDEFLVENYGKLTITDMAEHLGKSYDAVSHRLSFLGLREETNHVVKKVRATDRYVRFKR